MLPIRRVLFWDIDVEKLDISKHRRLIIERVLTLGNLDEFRFILKTYEYEILTNEIKKFGYPDPKTMNFVVSFFRIRKRDLRCYMKKQSVPVHRN